MRALSHFEGIFLCRDYTDMRKGANGLAVKIEQELHQSLFERHIFVFTNRTRTTVKMLYWDNTGFAVWHKRLEQATFKWPLREETKVVRLSQQQIAWLLEGYDISKMKPHISLVYRTIS